MTIDNPARRTMMAAMAALPLSPAPAAGNSSRTLVAYFSRSGNTRVIAGVIQRAEKADLFEIRSARPYPLDYFETVEQARQERDRGDQPPLAEKVNNIAAYQTIFLGFPVWGETMPPVIRAFLSTHNLSGKVVVPFITHGGYGVGNSSAELAKHAGRARIQPALVMEADQERRTTTQVQDWLAQVAPRGS
jgi:flavodoxin